MKKRTLAYLTAAAACCVALVGGTLAYFTDTAEQENVFTTGNVSIELDETFDAEDAWLVPGVDITKEIRVENTGSMPAYVRVHMAIPSMLDSGSEDEPQYAAYNNTLHWNFSKASAQQGEWSQFQNASQVGPNADYPNWPANGNENYNMYQQTVDGILYNVYVITYETDLAAGATTATNAIEKVYLDTKVTNEQMTEIIAVLGKTPKILVVAEGCQKDPFTDAYTALDTCFGVPGTYNPWA